MMNDLDDLQSQTARGDELAAAVEGLELERAALAAEVELLRGAIAAQDDRDRAAADRAGVLYSGCDTSGDLAAEVERLTAELANRPPGYLAALDARDEAQLYLIRIMAALDMVVNDTTYDEVVAEVERLTAESNELQTLLDGAEAERDEWMETAETTEGELCRFMDDLIAVVGEQVIVGDEVKFSAIVAAVAALRAQLEAGEGWRPGSEAPLGEVVEGLHAIIEVDYHHDFRGSWWSVADGRWISTPLQWRPTPPQE